MSLGSDFVPAVSENEPSRRDHLLRIVQIANRVVATGVVNAAIARNEVPVYLALTQSSKQVSGRLVHHGSSTTQADVPVYQEKWLRPASHRKICRVVPFKALN